MLAVFKLLFTILVTCFTNEALATPSLGLGLTSDGAGVSLADDLDAKHFAQGLIGVGDRGQVVADADYLFTSALNPNLGWYVGPGLAMRSYAFGPRIPLGIRGHFNRVPLELAGEVAPTVLFGRATWGFFDAGLYLRYILK